MKRKIFTKLIAGTLSAAMLLGQMPVSVAVQAKESGITAIGKQTTLITDRYTSSGVESVQYTKGGGNIQALEDAAIAGKLSLTGKGTTEGGEGSNIAPGSAYSVATAFDPDGDGIADWIARVSLEDEERGGRVLLSVSQATDGNGDGTVYVAFLNEDTGGYIKTVDDIPARAVEGLINIAAGDFDGDGIDELAIYTPNNSDEVETLIEDADGNSPKNQLSVKIYDMDFNLDINSKDWGIKTSIPEPTKVIEVGEGTTTWNHSTIYEYEQYNKQYYGIPYLSLMAEDIDGDGIDDLTTTASFAELKDLQAKYGYVSYCPLSEVAQKLFSADFRLASVLDIYTGSKKTAEYMIQTVKKKVLMGYDDSYSDSNSDSEGRMFAVRNATVAIGSVSDSKSRELIIAGNCSTVYDPLSTRDVYSDVYGRGRAYIYRTSSGRYLETVTPKVVLGCFTYEELKDTDINSLETVSNWNWTYTDSGSYDLRCRYELDSSGTVCRYSILDKSELEPVAMVPFAAYGTDEPDSVFLEGQVYRYNTETKKFENTKYWPESPTNYSDSKGIWIGTAVAGNVTGSADGAETVYYTYYELNANETACYCSVVGLWGKEIEGRKTYDSAVKSNSKAAFPMHMTLVLPEEAAMDYEAKAEIDFAEGELDEDGCTYLVEGGCTPKVIVTYKDKQLRPGKDYYVTYADNTEAGTATVTITGRGDYKGTGTLNFEIISNEDEGETSYKVEPIETINADNRTWDSYASYYYYNQLDEEGKALWNGIDAVCKELLTTTEDARAAIDGEGNSTYYTAPVYSKLKRAAVKKIYACFMYSNPQYYFLTNYQSMTSGNNKYSFNVNAVFADGEDRKKATEFVEQKLAEYYKEIDKCDTDEKKVRKIHDLILENTKPELGNGGTIYEVLKTGTAYCTGYARLFQVLATGAGISSVFVGSESYNHAWNMVHLNGSWYNIDVTGDDPANNEDGRLYYTFYLVSDAENDGKNAVVDDWCKPIPEATLSSGSTMTTAGTIQAAKGTTSAPKIAIDTTSGSTVVTLTAKSNETIYYSLDGTTPGLTRGASSIYTEAITIKEPCVIKAVAVREGYVDSKVSVQAIEGMRFDGNGCDEGEVASILYGSNTQVTIPENGYKKAGYRFTGWNTAADGTGTAYEAGQALEVASLGGILTLYAQWEEEEYTITYELAGGTNNSSNPGSYKRGDKTITLAEPKQTGYDFGGWYTDEKYTAEVETIPSGSTGAITLYAKWTPIIYAIQFDANGGKGSMNWMTNCKYGETYTFPANKFTRTGYTFVGWCNYSDGSQTIYKDQSDFSNLADRNNVAMRMFAIWKKNDASKDDTSKDDTSKDDTSKDDTSKDDTSKDDTSKDDTSKDDTSKDDTSKDDTSKDDTSKDDTSKDDTSKDDTSKDDTSKDDTSKKKIGSVTLAKTTYTYTGKSIKPAVTVRSTDKKVVNKKDYTVKYSGNKNVGTARVTITFKNDYRNNRYITKTFKIIPKGTKISKITPGKKKLTVKVKAQKKQTTGYQIRYSMKKNMKGAKMITLSKNTKLTGTISKLKAKKTYYVQVRTYKKVSGRYYYSNWSKTYSKKTK